MHAGDIRLRPALEKHRERLRYACAQDPRIWDIYPRSFFGEHFDEAFDDCLDGARDRAFVILQGDILVGMTSYLDIDERHRSLEIGRTYIVPRVRGTGLNGRVKTLMLDTAFAAGFARVELRVDTRNARSMAAVEKLGARREATLPHNRLTWTGSVRDTAVYAVHAHEWRRYGVEAAFPIKSA